MKLTKEMIEELVKEIEDFLREYEMLGDVCIYFNNKRHLWCNKYDKEWNYLGVECTTEEDVFPLDYFEYVNHHHILSMSFEGDFNHVMNGYTNYAWELQEKFLEILNKYNLYYELGHSWNLSCYPTNDDMEIEYTDYSKKVKPKPVYIYMTKDNVLPELKNIMIAWYKLSDKTGDGGGCVLGEGMNFEYKGTTYKMAACSPYQGELSWTPHVETVKEMLRNIGATNISWDCGLLD